MQAPKCELLLFHSKIMGTHFEIVHLNKEKKKKYFCQLSDSMLFIPLAILSVMITLKD